MADEKKEDGLEEASDAKASVGDIFGVSAGKKKKKKEKPAPAPEPESLEDDSVPFPDQPAKDVPGDDEPTHVAKAPEAPTPDAPRKAKSKKTAGLEGVLIPGAAPERSSDDDYLGPQDMGDYAPPKSKTVPILSAIIVLLLLVIGVGAVSFLGLGGDVVALFKGELREKRIAEARMEEEKFKADQLAKLDRFGNLMISGAPQYALIKLNGQVQYGQTSAGWRELRIGTTPGVQDLKVKQTHTVEFSSPGFDPFSVEVTEGKWQEVSGGGGYVYSVTPTLLPSSVHAKQEYDARMAQDSDNEYFGKISINTIPSGAKVIFDNNPLLDEKGQEMKTPVSFDKYYKKDEKTGKLEEVMVRVDTTFDVGHRIELEMEYPNSCPEGAAPECGKADGCCPAGAECSVALDADCKWPRYITSLMRPMWTCNWKDGAPPAEIAKDKTIQHYCDYAFTLDLDFNGLKNYIVAREEERKRIMEQYKQAAPDAGHAAEAAETAQAP